MPNLNLYMYFLSTTYDVDVEKNYDEIVNVIIQKYKRGFIYADPTCDCIDSVYDYLIRKGII